MSQQFGFTVKPATPADVPQLVGLIHALAKFEQLTHLFECTEERLSAALYGCAPQAEALLAWEAEGREPVGFALFFHNFSTFLGKRGLYLEDLFVRPECRGRGCGTALLAALARIALERDCGRFEWSVLDWNVAAQGFYRQLGATVLPDWRIVRMTGGAIAHLAARDGGTSE
jgi:GNAT superfamily N-acetyltransferase